MVSSNNQGHVWKQSNWKMLRDELFIYIMTRRPLLPLQEDSNKDVTWAMFPSTLPWGRWGYPNRSIMDNREQLCQSFMENTPLRMKWGSGIHCSSFSIGLWTKFWSRSAWEWLLQFMCFEVFPPACILLFLLEWNTKQKLPDIQTALLMTHWPTPWL